MQRLKAISAAAAVSLLLSVPAYADSVLINAEKVSAGQGATVIISAEEPQADEFTVAEELPSPSSTAIPSTSPEPTPVPTSSPEPEITEETGSGYIGGDYVRFRTGPSTSSSIISTYNWNQPLEILGLSGDWTQCAINGKTGFVFSKYVVKTASTEEAAAESAESVQLSALQEQASVQAYISGNNVRFREGPSLSAGIIKEFQYGAAVTVSGTVGDWSAVNCDGTNGYVFSKYVAEGVSPLQTAQSEQSTAQFSATGQDIASYALSFLGTKYVYGGTDPSTGFDCSGLVYYVYSHFGYSINRVAADQALNGTAVDADSLQPGDILCFYSGGTYIGHSGIYIGDGKFVHAANSATGVIVTELSGSYWSRGFEARRIIA